MARKRIKIAEFRGEPAEVEFPDGSVYLIRGDIPMEAVVYMADLEERITDEMDEEDQAVEYEKWLAEGNELLLSMIREASTDQREVTIPTLGAHELLGVFGSMVGGDSVGHAIATAMVNGMSEALNAKNAADAADAADPTPPKRDRRKKEEETAAK